jgi:cytidyltransferase-like protein
MNIFTSGSFDPLHSGHIALFEACARLGDLYVGIGNDGSVSRYKHTVYQSQEERLYMVKAIKYVTDASINTGDGFLDYITDPMFMKCDVLVINKDGYSEQVRALCQQLGKILVMMDRLHAPNLPERSSTQIRHDINNH